LPWRDIVERIQRGDASAMEDMYKTFSTGVRFLLCRRIGADAADDKVHDVFLIVTKAIINGELRDPDRLMGYVYGIVRKQVASYIDQSVQMRRRRVDVDSESLSDTYPCAERKAIASERLGLAIRVLQSISKRDREVLTRFYLNEESAEEICRDMRLSETQFRLAKSRAKARFAKLGKRCLSTLSSACA
jgi:RNA polymerase sigma factor (sigma-70 family)